MAYAKPVWGIDVGQRALKAIRLRWTGGGPQILDLAVVEHAKILSQPDADEEQLVRDALEKFAREKATRGDRVVVGVPGQTAFARFIKLPPVERKKIPEIVRYEARQQIPFAIEDVLWDYQPVGREASGLETEIGLFAMKKDMINDFVSNFVMAKIEVEVVQIAPLALYNFLVVDGQIGEGATVLLDVGAENTNLLITDGNRIWLRNIPLGGNNFTRAISKARKLTFAHAEAEKRALRQRKDARELLEVIRPVFTEILGEVQRSIGYFTSLHRDVRIERILGTGGAFRTPGLRHFLAQSLQYRVDEFRGFNKVGEAEALKTPIAREHLLGLPAAYGLALQGLEVAPIHTNLLPPEIRRARVIKRKQPLAAAAVAVLALAVGVSYLGAVLGQGGGVDPDLENKANALRQQAAGFEAEKQKVEAQAKAAALPAQPLQFTVRDRGVWLAVYNELLKIFPDSEGDEWVRIEELVRYEAADDLSRMIPEGQRLDDPTIEGKWFVWAFRLSAFTRAKQGPQFLEKRFFQPLQSSPFFTQVRLEPNGLRARTVQVPELRDRSDTTPGAAGAVRMREVEEWQVRVTFLCVPERVMRVLRGEPPITPEEEAKRKAWQAQPGRPPEAPAPRPMPRGRGM